MVTSPFSGYNPGAHRMISTILKSIAELDDDHAVPALRNIPRSAREVLRFCYGNHEIDLPTDNIDVTPISPRAFVEAGIVGDEDLLAAEAHKLVRLFVRGVHPTLTSKRRLELWTDIMERLEPAERALMETIRRDRLIPGITRQVVDAAFPGMLDAKPTALDLGIPNPTPALAATPASEEPRVFTEDELKKARDKEKYGRVYSQLRFG